MTPRAIRQLADGLNLQMYYGGEVVAGVRTVPGHFVVLAVGYADVRELFGQLNEEERAQVVLEHPQPVEPPAGELPTSPR